MPGLPTFRARSVNDALVLVPPKYDYEAALKNSTPSSATARATSSDGPRTTPTPPPPTTTRGPTPPSRRRPTTRGPEDRQLGASPCHSPRPRRLTPRMGRPTPKAIDAYNATLQRLLRIQDWRLTVDHDNQPNAPDLPHGVWATVWAPTPTKREALVRYNDDLFNQDPETQREAFVHELIHLHLYPLWFHHQEAIKNNSARLRDYASTAYWHSEEKTTDALATVIAPYLPLPPWTQKKRTK